VTERRIKEVIVTNAVQIGASHRANKIALDTGANDDHTRYEWFPTRRCPVTDLAKKPANWPGRKAKSCTVTIPAWLWAKLHPGFKSRAVHTIVYEEDQPRAPKVDDGTDTSFAARRKKALSAETVTKTHAATDPVFKSLRDGQPRVKLMTLRELETSYTRQRRTKVVAVRCCVCSRDLIDNVSIEAGMGPTCRKKYGDKLDRAKAERARKLIWVAAITTDPATFRSCIAKLNQIGAHKVADRLAANIAEVKVSYVGDTIHIETPRYNPDLVSAVKRMPQRAFAKFDITTGERLPRDTKKKGRAVWMVPQRDETALWEALIGAIGGKFAQDVTGLFTIPSIKEEEVA